MNFISKIKSSKNFEFQIIIVFILLVSIAISNILNRNLFIEKYDDNLIKISSYQHYHTTNEKMTIEVQNYQNNYNCEVNHNLDERHRLRWLSQLGWLKIYEFKTSIFGKKKIVYDLHKFFIGLIIFLSYLCIILLFQKNESQNIIFPISGIFTFFFLLIASSSISEINYSIVELFFLSLSFYAIFKNINWLFFLICILSPMNRESGFILPFIYLIFNPEKLKFFLLILFSSIFIYILVNLSTIKCVFTPGFLITTTPGYPKFMDHSFIEKFKIITQDYFFYLLILIVYWKNKILQKKFLLIILIYTFVFIIATPFQHSIIKILYIPTVMLYVYSSISPNLKINK